VKVKEEKIDISPPSNHHSLYTGPKSPLPQALTKISNHFTFHSLFNHIYLRETVGTQCKTSAPLLPRIKAGAAAQAQTHQKPFRPPSRPETLPIPLRRRRRPLLHLLHLLRPSSRSPTFGKKPLALDEVLDLLLIPRDHCVSSSPRIRMLSSLQSPIHSIRCRFAYFLRAWWSTSLARVLPNITC
jgi:hypothetical protein